MHIDDIQAALREEHLDGWLFFDHHHRDPLAYRILKLNPQVVTRRWYYFIPANGDPRGLVHAVESGVLAGLPGDVRKYSSWSTHVDGLRGLLAGSRITSCTLIRAGLLHRAISLRLRPGRESPRKCRRLRTGR
jgi:hypothetical protein